MLSSGQDQLLVCVRPLLDPPTTRDEVRPPGSGGMVTSGVRGRLASVVMTTMVHAQYKTYVTQRHRYDYLHLSISTATI